MFYFVLLFLPGWRTKALLMLQFFADVVKLLVKNYLLFGSEVLAAVGAGADVLGSGL